MRAYLATLRESPASLTRAQKIAFALLAAAIALTRFPALSLTVHDWDEMLFAAGVPDYDVKVQHPHPPGYPLFIAAAKIARLFTDTDFHAVQAVAAVASMLIFPAAFLLARELRFRTSYAFAAAAMTAFLPSIWYHGGTALSDVPGLALILFACALLLRGGRSGRAYLAGALLTAIACGIRGQLLLVAAPPALLGALALRRWTTFATSWLAAAAVVFLTYLGAAYFSSDFPTGYLEQVRYINKHLHDTDSYHNPYRTPLRELAPRVFLFPEGGGRARYAVVALAAIALLDALLRRRVSIAVLLAMFLPMAVFTWLMFDMTALARYAIAYLPLHAFLAVAGAEALAQLVPSRARVPLFLVLSSFVTWSLIKWTWPALRFARTEPSPGVAAVQWIRANVPKTGPRLFVQVNLAYHAAYFLDGYDYRIVGGEGELREEDVRPGNLYLFEGQIQSPGARMFTRKRLQLWEISRPRYFEVGILPAQRLVRFGRGWHMLETDGQSHWRWMQRTGEVFLGPMLNGQGELRLKLHAPVDATPKPPVITLTWNGTVLDRRTAPAPDGRLELRYVLPGLRDHSNVLGLATDQIIRPPGDGRELGLSLEAVSWSEPAATRLQ